MHFSLSTTVMNDFGNWGFWGGAVKYLMYSSMKRLIILMVLRRWLQNVIWMSVSYVLFSNIHIPQNFYNLNSLLWLKRALSEIILIYVNFWDPKTVIFLKFKKSPWAGCGEPFLWSRIACIRLLEYKALNTKSYKKNTPCVKMSAANLV